MKVIRIFIICLFIIYSSCDKDPARPLEEKSIIGSIIDKASGQGISGSLVKIVNYQNAYQTTTDTQGAFSFTNIKNGDYLLSTETIQNGKVLTDTCGEFSTDSPDWGSIYSEVFASITGRVSLEDADDHSFINVQLLGTDKSALTTNQGKFRIDFILPDTYDLYISKNSNYKEIQILDIEIQQGNIIQIDTTLNYRFKPLTLQKVTDWDSLNSKDAGFCFASEYFWYTNWKGLLRYDPINNIEEQVYILYNSGAASNIHYLGEPYVTYDYDDGIWLSMDEPMVWYYRKYSISENRIVDSIKVSTLPTHNCFRIAYDLSSNSLVLFNSYTNFYPVIHKYNLYNGTTESVNLELTDYDFDDFKSINIERVLIDPDGKIYFILKIVDLNNKKECHLYICNNLDELELIKIYKFTDTYSYPNRLSYYENDIYTVNKGLLYKLVF